VRASAPTRHIGTISGRALGLFSEILARATIDSTNNVHHFDELGFSAELDPHLHFYAAAADPYPSGNTDPTITPTDFGGVTFPKAPTSPEPVTPQRHGGR
jgi:hypothetical protein